MGFGSCVPVSFLWDGRHQIDSDATDPATNGVSAELVVPDGTGAGAHEVRASCRDGHSTAEFTVVVPETPPTLTLIPAQGASGTSFTATAAGFGACVGGDVSFRWDDKPLQPASSGADGAFTFAVPDDTSSGDHKVTATCGSAQAPATFTVVAAPKPTLSLDTGHGPGGSQLMASGTGYACGDGDVQLLWDDDIRLTYAPSDTFSAVPLPIPSQAPLGVHTVVASCERHPDIADSQRFTVTSVTTSATTRPAELTLQPTSGHPGDQVRATGVRIACANHSGPVNLSWDDGTLLPDESLDPSGHFDASISVPANTEARRLTLRATCSDGVMLAADFTVLTSTPPPPPPPPPKIPWLLILLIVAGATLFAVQYARRHWRKPPEAPPHVQAVPRPDGPPVVALRETPERGEATYALRVEAHTGLGTLTVGEVDDDQTAE
jgi:hypothetical protein